MNLQDKPIDQIRDVARFLGEKAQLTTPPGETQWEEMRYDLGNIAMFLEAFTIPAMENPITRHEYKVIAPRQTPGPRIAQFGRDEDIAAGTER